jgi:hypothetical protein
MVRQSILSAVLVLTTVFAAGQATAPADVLTLTGTLKTGVVAAGGETTGMTLTVERTTYELEFKDAGLRKTAEGLNGKSVTVKGSLTIQFGTEMGQRRILAVTALEAAKGAAASAAASAPASGATGGSH